VLDWDSPNIRLTTLASSTSLTVTTANYALARTIYTYAPAISASLTALPAATYPGLAKWLTTTLSSVSLSATSAPMTKTNSGTPTIKLLTTVASAFDLSASEAKIMPIQLTTEESGFSFTATDSGVSITQGPITHGYYVTTVSSDVTLSSSTAAVFYSQRFLLTEAGAASLTASDAIPTKNIPLKTVPSVFTLSANNASLFGWWTLETLPTSFSLSTALAQRGFMRASKGHSGRGRKHRLGSVSDARLHVRSSRIGSTSEQTGRAIRVPLGKVESE
jgi:hypothetical protein